MMDLAVRGSELCRALCESSFEMYIQCEGLKWFLLNSIFYRFCRHFVVGRKKIKEILWVHFCFFFCVTHSLRLIIIFFNCAKHGTILAWFGWGTCIIITPVTFTVFISQYLQSKVQTNLNYPFVKSYKINLYFHIWFVAKHKHPFL